MSNEKNDQTSPQAKPVSRRLSLFTHLARTSPERLASEAASVELGDTQVSVLHAELQAIDATPQIVLIGKTGVGKSSTINKLFNPEPNLPVDHIEPATMNIEILTLSLGDRGRLIIVDCPGLGDSEEADRRNMQAYRDILAVSDVAVWILKADDRTLGIDQKFILSVLPGRLKEHLVVGINQVDLTQPGEWSTEFNLPAREQELNIQRKQDYVMKRFRNAGIEPFRVVPYSALRTYRLTKLFRAMVDACPKERVPALVSRSDMKSFLSPSLQATIEKEDS